MTNYEDLANRGSIITTIRDIHTEEEWTQFKLTLDQVFHLARKSRLLFDNEGPSLTVEVAFFRPQPSRQEKA